MPRHRKTTHILRGCGLGQSICTARASWTWLSTAERCILTLSIASRCPGCRAYLSGITTATRRAVVVASPSLYNRTLGRGK